MNPILEARALSQKLGAPRHLPSKGVRHLIRHPDFGEKVGSKEPGQDSRVHLVGLDLRGRDGARATRCGRWRGRAERRAGPRRRS